MLGSSAILRNTIIALALFATRRCEAGAPRMDARNEARAKSAALQQTGHTY
jgi:hypothetical protein